MKIVGSCYVNPQAKLVHLETQNLLLAQSSHDLMWDPLRKVLLQGSTQHSLPKQISRLTLYENRNLKFGMHIRHIFNVGLTQYGRFC